jgi:uncharacterized protein (TIGR02271 family)
MGVRSTSGISLGKIVAFGPGGFSVEKGAFFPKDHELRYDSIVDISGDEVTCRLAESAATRQEEPATTRQEASAAALKVPSAVTPKEEWQQAELAEGSELRVPLMEERVHIQKSTKEVGAVRVHKNVVTEEHKVTVPVRHEEVVVEHVPAERAVAKPAHAFEHERYSIAVHQEEFEVVKQPALKEEVRVRRVTHEEQRSAVASARHEELEVEDQTRRTQSISDPEKKEV